MECQVVLDVGIIGVYSDLRRPFFNLDVIDIVIAEVVRVDVYDYTGRNVATFQGQTTLDLSRLASGLYTLRVTLPERIEVRRVVKQ